MKSDKNAKNGTRRRRRGLHCRPLRPALGIDPDRLRESLVSDSQHRSGPLYHHRAGVETKAVATTCNPGSTFADWPDQIWQYQFDNYRHRLQNRASGLYLVARGQQVESQAVQTWSCPTCADQYWFDV